MPRIVLLALVALVAGSLAAIASGSGRTRHVELRSGDSAHARRAQVTCIYNVGSLECSEDKLSYPTLSVHITATRITLNRFEDSKHFMTILEVRR